MSIAFGYVDVEIKRNFDIYAKTSNTHWNTFVYIVQACTWEYLVLNPLSDMPILGSSNSAANKNMMSKIWTNGDAII